ncbi:hypothetical protein MY10362_008693 [Beauveria mimosiformis]
MALMREARSESVLDHDEAKFPVAPFKCNVIEVPNIVTTPAVKRHYA